MAFVDIFKTKGPAGFGSTSTAREVVAHLDLTGKCYVITGVNSGLGLASAQALSERGAQIIGLARTIEKAEEAMSTLEGDGHQGFACELSEPASVRAAGQWVAELSQPIDGLLLNAGIMALPQMDIKYGLERQFLVNHMGHFLLVQLSLGALAPGARVVVLSSAAHQRTYKGGIDFERAQGKASYSAFKAYGQSKLANLLFARELGRRLEGHHEVYAVHPGVIPTNLMRNMGSFVEQAMQWTTSLFFKTIEQGASTQCFALTHESLKGHSGAYLADCKIRSSTRRAHDEELMRALWEFSEEWLQDWMATHLKEVGT